MPITVLYVMLGICAALLIGVGVAMFVRVRRLSRASDTQFRRAVEAEETPELAEARQARAVRENG